MSVDKVTVFNTFLHYLFAPIVCIFRKRGYLCVVVRGKGAKLLNIKK